MNIHHRRFRHAPRPAALGADQGATIPYTTDAQLGIRNGDGGSGPGSAGVWFF